MSQSERDSGGNIKWLAHRILSNMFSITINIGFDY